MPRRWQIPGWRPVPSFGVLEGKQIFVYYIMMDFKRRTKFLGSTAVMVALSPLAVQQIQAASLSIGAYAAIGTGVGFTQVRGLDFATFTQAGTRGTLRLGFSDNLSVVGGGINPVGGTPSSGDVMIKVLPGIQLKLSSTAATYKITAFGGGPNRSMTVSNINYRLGSFTGPNLTLTPTVLTNNLHVGADLKSNLGQIEGAYTGVIRIMMTAP